MQRRGRGSTLCFTLLPLTGLPPHPTYRARSSRAHIPPHIRRDGLQPTTVPLLGLICGYFPRSSPIYFIILRAMLIVKHLRPQKAPNRAGILLKRQDAAAAKCSARLTACTGAVYLEFSLAHRRPVQSLYSCRVKFLPLVHAHGNNGFIPGNGQKAGHESFRIARLTLPLDQISVWHVGYDNIRRTGKGKSGHDVGLKQLNRNGLGSLPISLRALAMASRCTGFS